MHDQEKTMTVDHEILKEKHETLMRDYENLQEKLKHEEETYENLKKHLQSKTKELEVTNIHLLDDYKRERIEKMKYKKLFEEEMKKMDSECKGSNSMIDELMKKNQELLLAKMKEEEEQELVKIENKYSELGDKLGVIETECSYLKSLYDAQNKLGVIETECSYLKSLYDAQVTAATTVMEDLIGHGGNEVNHNVINNVTDTTVINDGNDNLPRESNIRTQRSVDRNQEGEQGRNRTSFSNVSSSDSDSDDGYEVVVQLPANWPDWAKPNRSQG